MKGEITKALYEIYDDPQHCDICENIYEGNQLGRCCKCRKIVCTSCQYATSDGDKCSNCVEGAE